LNKNCRLPFPPCFPEACFTIFFTVVINTRPWEHTLKWSPKRGCSLKVDPELIVLFVLKHFVVNALLVVGVIVVVVLGVVAAAVVVVVVLAVAAIDLVAVVVLAVGSEAIVSFCAVLVAAAAEVPAVVELGFIVILTFVVVLDIAITLDVVVAVLDIFCYSCFSPCRC
jgi:hypothetical protein